MVIRAYFRRPIRGEILCLCCSGGIHPHSRVRPPAILRDASGVQVCNNRATVRLSTGQMLHVYFATSRSKAEPTLPYAGKMKINGAEIGRPLLLRNFPTHGEFTFSMERQPQARLVCRYSRSLNMSESLTSAGGLV